MQDSIFLNIGPSQSSQSQIKLNIPISKKYVLSKMISLSNEHQQNANNQIDQRLKRKTDKTPQYFTNILKQQKKNMFVNTFLRKLKKSIILKQIPQHQYLNEQKQNSGQDDDQLQLKLPKIVQLILLFIWAILGFVLMITNSLALLFIQINQSSAFQTFMIISLLAHILQTGCKFIIHLNFQQNKITKIKQITRKYLQFDFWLDLTIAIALLMNFIIPASKNTQSSSKITQLSQIYVFFRLLIFIKIHSLNYIVQHLQITLIQNVYRQQIWSLVKVFCFNFTFAHILTLALLLMARLDLQNNWLISREIDQAEWIEKYIWAYYWAITIMLTVGFGDITPRNSSEALCMIFIETTSCIILAYNVNRVGMIISKILSYQAQKNSNLKTFNHINQKSQFSDETKTRIMNYIKQSTQMRRNFNLSQQKQFLDHLPSSFKSDILKQMNRHIWNGMKFFQNLSQDTIQKLSITIQKKLAHPQQIVYQRGKDIDILVFNQGSFGYSYNNGNSINNGNVMQFFKVNSKDYQVASLDFLFQNKLTYDIKSTDYCIFYKISTDDFIKILKNCSYDLQYYFMIKDKDKFIINQFQLCQCEICRKQYHSVFKCPRLHFIPLKQHIIRKYRYKYYPRIFQYDINRNYMKKSRTLIERVRNKEKIQSARKIMNIFMNTYDQAIDSDYSDQQSDYGNQQYYKQENSDHMNPFLENSNPKILNSSGNNNMNSSKNINPPSGPRQGRRGTVFGLQMIKNTQTFYQHAMNEIKSKLDNMIQKPKFQWDIEVDQAHNYKFYFRKNNPDEIFNLLSRKPKQKPKPTYKNQKITYGYRKKYYI